MKDEATQVHPAQYAKAYSIKISRNTYKTRSSMKWGTSFSQLQLKDFSQSYKKSAIDTNAEKTQLSSTDSEFYDFIFWVSVLDTIQ